MPGCRLKAHGAGDLVLVAGTVAMVLGIAATAASLGLSAATPRHRAQERLPIVIHGDGSPDGGPLGSGGNRVQARALPTHPAEAPAPASFGRPGATGLWISSLALQNEIALWAWIKVSSAQDPRAYLLGTAIQVHGRTTTAIPTSHVDPLHVRLGR